MEDKKYLTTAEAVDLGEELVGKRYTTVTIVDWCKKIPGLAKQPTGKFSHWIIDRERFIQLLSGGELQEES